LRYTEVALQFNAIYCNVVVDSLGTREERSHSNIRDSSPTN